MKPIYTEAGWVEKVVCGEDLFGGGRTSSYS